MTPRVWFAWLWIVAGLASGVASGLFFAREDWLGGYASWRRRLLRLMHVSFFGTAALNLAFAWTVPDPGARAGLLLASRLLIAGAIVMPLACALAAWRPSARPVFALPVGCLLAVATSVLFALR